MATHSLAYVASALIVGTLAIFVALIVFGCPACAAQPSVDVWPGCPTCPSHPWQAHRHRRPGGDGRRLHHVRCRGPFRGLVA
jgi:hypothetical protein